jgi:predicted AAA+ superfamily ATPase
VSELKDSVKPDEALALLNRLGGFPEPFLSGSDTEASRWRNQYYTDLIREDILEFGRLQEVRSMRLLLELLRSRVGSPLSYTSIAQDLQIAPNTVSLHCVYRASLSCQCGQSNIERTQTVFL